MLIMLRGTVPQGVLRGLWAARVSHSALPASISSVIVTVLTKPQRNQLFEQLGGGGLQQSLCKFADPETDEQSGTTYAEIRQASSDSHFMVWPDRDQFALFRARMKVGGVEATAVYTGSWNDILGAAQDWAQRVVYELNAPDLWAELVSPSGIFGETQGDEDNSAFTAEERTAISARIEEVKAEVRQNPALTGDQISGIEQKLDDLIEASERVGKKDWKLLVAGTLLTIFVTYAVPPHVAQAIITSVITGLGHMFGIGGLPPSLPPQA